MIHAEAINVTHPTVGPGCSIGLIDPCTFNYESLISSAIAIVLTLAFAFWVRSRLQDRTPGKVQAIFEWGYYQLKSLIQDNVSEDALFILPLAMTLFLYILIANWLEFLPLGFVPFIHGPNSDLNQTAAMALVVIIVVQWYSIRVLGLAGYLRRFTKPFELPWPARIVFIPLNIIEEVTKPVTLAMRLFGNIFAGAAIIGLIVGFGTLALPYVGALPGTIVGSLLLILWKGFDVIFIGFIQAFIFMLLTVVYFGAAREGLEHEHSKEA